MFFWQKSKEASNTKFQKLSADSLIFYIKQLPKKQQEEKINILLITYHQQRKKVIELEKELTTKRMPFWPKNKILSSAISSLFGMSLRYGYDWLFDNNQTMFSTMARGSSNLFIAISSLYLFNYFQSQTETEELVDKIDRLSSQVLVFRQILQQLGLNNDDLSQANELPQTVATLGYG